MKSLGFVSELGVESVERSIRFYEDVLGVRLVESVEGDDGVPFWAEVDLSGTRLMFESLEMLAGELPGVSPESDVMPTAALVVRIEPRSAAVEVLERLTSSGIEVSSGPSETDYGSYEFSFSDPDGYVIVVAGRD